MTMPKMPKAPSNDFNERILEYIENHKPNENELQYQVDREKRSNICFAKDLCITFPMSEQQHNEYDETIKRYKKYIAVINQKKNLQGFLYSYFSRSTKEEFKEVLNEKEYFQSILLSMPYLSNKINLFLTDQHPYSNENAFLEMNPYNGSKMDIFISRDRTGLIKNAFRDTYLNTKDVIRFVTGTGIFKYQSFDQYFSLVRYNSDGTIDLIREAVAKYGAHFRDEATLNPCKSQKTLFPHCVVDIASQNLKENYKAITGEEYSNYSKLSDQPVIGKWVNAINSNVGKYKLPNIKEICHSALKEMFLINPTNTKEMLRKLTFDALSEFIVSCSIDLNPVGFEIIRSLMEEKDEHFKKPLADCLGFDRYLESMFNHDSFFRQNYNSSIQQNIFTPMYSDKFALNVYDNFDRFKLEKYPDHLESTVIFPIPNNNQLQYGSASIVDKSSFINNFHNATNNIFKDKWPKGMVVYGGIITKCLLGQEIGFESADIDIAFINDLYYPAPDTDQLIDLLGGYIIVETEYSVCQAGSDTTPMIVFVGHYPKRHIQLDYYGFYSVEELLLGVDIESSCFLFNGTDVFTLERGLQAMNHRVNFATTFSRAIRGAIQYERRLIKYTTRGFGIASLVKDYEIMKSKFASIIPNKFQVGLALIHSAAVSETVLQELNKKNQNCSLPYGPNVNKEKFEKKVKENFDNYYDGYNSSDYPALFESIEDIKDHYHHRTSNISTYGVDKDWFDVKEENQLKIDVQEELENNDNNNNNNNNDL